MTQTTDENTRFDVSNILYSRSDARGVVAAGNRSFQTVSGYAWDRLIGAPHKILRHPETPQGVFFKLWTTIQSGDPVGAYILNRAEDGSDYWVYATVVPVPNGYVSIRLKPSCGMLEKIRPIYQTLRDQERDKTLTPEHSAAAIDTAVQTLGFSDYFEFMSFTLRDEMSARHQQLGRAPMAIWDNLSEIFAQIRRLEARARDIEKTFRQTHQIPYNMRLQAGRLEGSDGPISVISSNHRQMTQALEHNMARFSEDSSVGAGAVKTALFKTCVSHLVDDVIAGINTGAETLHQDAVKEQNILTALGAKCRQDSATDVTHLSEKVRKFGIQCQDMRRMMSGLELTRIMCKIERSKFQGDLAGLDEIVNKLGTAQASLGKSFDGILDAVSRILNGAGDVARAVTRENEARDAKDAA